MAHSKKENGEGRSEKHFSFWLMIIAVFFLFNPDFAVIDLLPDIVAYILITVCLKKFADINDKMEEARKRFLLMIYVSAAKLISILFLFGVTDDYMRPYSMLLYPCVFGVIELILLIPAFKSFFDGISYLSFRNDGSLASFYLFPSKNGRVRRVRRDAKNITERTCAATIFFVVCKATLSVLPEFSVLTASTYDETGAAIDLYDYVGLLRVLGTLLMLLIGVIWLVRVVRYFLFIQKDTALYKGLEARYESEISHNTGLFTIRRFNLAFTFLKLGAFFLVDFYVNYNNIFPDALYAVFATVAILLLSPYVSRARKNAALVATWLYGGVSLLASYVNYDFNAKHAVFEAIFRSEQAHQDFVYMCTSTAVESVTLVMAIVALCAVLYEVIYGHCGYISMHDSNEFVEAQHNTLCRELKAYLRRVFAFTLVTAVTAVIYDFLKQYQTRHTFLSQEFIRLHPHISSFLRDTLPSGFWVVDFALC